MMVSEAQLPGSQNPQEPRLDPGPLPMGQGGTLCPVLSVLTLLAWPWPGNLGKTARSPCSFPSDQLPSSCPLPAPLLPAPHPH